MKDQFVPFELAVKLKELGFNEVCICIWNREKALIANNLNNPDNRSASVNVYNNNGRFPAPLWQQSFDWIRENFNITFWIEPCGGWVKKAHLWEYVIVTHDNRHIGTRSEYHEEQEALLRELIRIIEEEEYDKEREGVC